MNDWKLVSAELQARAEELCRQILPGGKVMGGRYVAHDPVQGDYDKTPALSVLLHGKTGAWQAFRGGAEHEKHDLLGLIAYTQGLDNVGALNWAKNFLGMQNCPPEELTKRRREAQARTEAARRADYAREQRKRERIAVYWMCGKADISKAVPYFESRSINIREIPHFAAENFKFIKRMRHWEAQQTFPCIVAAIRRSNGEMAGLHFTFLDILCQKKAQIEKPKLMLGEVRGNIIELSRGADGKKFFEPENPPAPVVLAEGIETGLSIAYAVPEARVWACGSISNLGNAPLNLPCVGSIILARDNNYNNSQAAQQMEIVEEKLLASGKPYTFINSFIGDDFNDLLREEN